MQEHSLKFGHAFFPSTPGKKNATAKRTQEAVENSTKREACQAFEGKDQSKRASNPPQAFVRPTPGEKERHCETNPGTC